MRQAITKVEPCSNHETWYHDFRKIVFVVILALLFSVVMMVQVHALDIPTPQGYVTDTAGVLSVQERNALENHIADIEKNTTVEIAVLIIPSLNGTVLEDYANQVFRTWGVGKKDVNNGVLILVAMDDRQMRIEVGYGMEGSVTDEASGIIIRDIMTPAFQQKDYAGGLTKAVDAIAGLANGDPSVVSQYQSGSLSITTADIVWTVGLCVIYLIFAIIATIKLKKNIKRKWAWNGSGFVVVMLIGFLVGSFVGWVTAFLCFWILAVTMSVGAKRGSGGSGLLWLGGLGGFGRGGLGGGGSGGGGGFGGFGGGSSGGGGGSGGW